MKREFINAKRAEVEQIESLARETLEANPFDELTSETVEGEWRELAHAMRQLGPLFEAWEKAELGHQDFAEYRGGFDFRLTEAMATISEICSDRRNYPLRQQKNAKRKGKQEFDVLDTIILKLLKDGKKAAKEIWSTIVKKVDDIDGLELDGSELVVQLDKGRPERRVKETSFKDIVSRLKNQ
ncbi:MAG: hypothetical protein WBO09_13680 [Methylocystis silviterrae]|uniref:hypothetical protein n=1 Tax=Methylocystis silviterrae TaxID=2743612 RepID=UPI003BC3AF6A